MSVHPLEKLEGKRIDGYTLCIGKITPLPLSGWREFTLHLQDDKGTISEVPVIKGIYSVGGKDGVKPWMDVVYSERMSFIEEGVRKAQIYLRTHAMDMRLFSYLGELIPRGGHLMVSYEEDESIHGDTRESLSRGIPPVLTPLGFLIFQAGFQYVKDWYLSEGGFEGPRKLWGEKAPHEDAERTFYDRTVEQVRNFLEAHESSLPQDVTRAAVQRAQEVFNISMKVSM